MDYAKVAKLTADAGLQTSEVRPVPLCLPRPCVASRGNVRLCARRAVQKRHLPLPPHPHPVLDTCEVYFAFR